MVRYCSDEGIGQVLQCREEATKGSQQENLQVFLEMLIQVFSFVIPFRDLP